VLSSSTATFHYLGLDPCITGTIYAEYFFSGVQYALSFVLYAAQ